MRHYFLIVVVATSLLSSSFVLCDEKQKQKVGSWRAGANNNNNGELLLKDPAVDAIRISEHKTGLRLACFLNGTAGDEPSTATTPAPNKEGGSSSSSSSSGKVTTTRNSQIRWFHTSPGGGGSEVEVESKFVTVNSKGQSVMAMSENDARAGTVRCRLDHQELVWRVGAHFTLENYPHSEMVIEGEDLKLRCKLRPNAASEGKLTFSWFKVPEEDEHGEGEPILNSTAATANDEIDPHIRIVVLEDQSVLKIEDAVYEDRAYYRCVIELANGDASLNKTMQTLVRVKDKYAALYPFVGIVVEVLALSLIILICERRKSAQEDDDDEEEYEGAVTGSNGNSSNVRHRRT